MPFHWCALACCTCAKAHTCAPIYYQCTMSSRSDPFSVGFTIIRHNAICVESKTQEKTTCVEQHTVHIEGPCFEPDAAAHDATHEIQRRSCIGRNWIKGNRTRNVQMEGTIQQCALRSVHSTTQQATGRCIERRKRALFCANRSVGFQFSVLPWYTWLWSGDGKKSERNKVEKGAFCIAMCLQHISIHSLYASNRTNIFTGYSRYSAIVHNRLYCDEGIHSVDNFRQVNIRTLSTETTSIKKKLRKNFTQRKTKKA